MRGGFSHAAEFRPQPSLLRGISLIIWRNGGIVPKL
jgi:hypothetical protein